MAKKYIDAELLRKKVEKYYDEYRLKFNTEGDPYYLGVADGLDVAERVVDSLQQEQPCDTCTNDKGCVTCKDGELWEGKEQSCEDLEKEIEKFLASEDSTSYDNAGTYKVSFKDPIKIARHFYELGKQSKEPVSEDLEEAAEEYRRESYTKSVLPNIDGPMPEYGGSIKDAFISGAEWQAERLLKGSPMPEDTVIFQKGIEEGKRLMMEDAVEGLICATITGTDAISFLSPLPKELTAGDKVKIIIVKED